MNSVLNRVLNIARHLGTVNSVLSIVRHSGTVNNVLNIHLSTVYSVLNIYSQSSLKQCLFQAIFDVKVNLLLKRNADQYQISTS